MPGPTPHRTPLRRVSQGSLLALSRSGAHPDAPHGLGFIEPALAELADEADALLANVEGLHALGDSLQTFNESFASWLYVMNMNALTVDWPQAPTDASFIIAKRRAEEDARIALEVLHSQTNPEPSNLERTTVTTDHGDETAYAETTMPDASAVHSAKSTTTVKVKKKGKPKMTSKEKKERAAAVDKTISCLPLEFRGSDPGLRRNMEQVIEGLMERAGQGVKLHDLIKPPDLNQARVNKCLIALVNRKVVVKDNSSGSVLYHWQGVPV